MYSLYFYESTGSVEHKLLNYLKSHGFKNFGRNITSREITADKRKSFFKTNKFLFRIRDNGPDITKVDIDIPHKEPLTKTDLVEIETLQGKIYSHF
jgi:hypothetical protein